jgi:hypothetical protein
LLVFFSLCYLWGSSQFHVLGYVFDLFTRVGFRVHSRIFLYVSIISTGLSLCAWHRGRRVYLLRCV